MTPAERGEVRRLLCLAAPHPWRVRHDGCGLVAVTIDALVVAMEPDVARRLAHAIHAAADAAEES